MKRLTVLLSYTVIVIGGSYLYRDSASLMNMLGIGFIIVSFCSIGLLMASVVSRNPIGFGPCADLNYIKAKSCEGTQGVTSFVSILSVIY